MRPILTLACLLLLAAAPGVEARTLKARIAKVDTAAVQLDGVRLRLHWPDGAKQGELLLQAQRVRAPDLGYDFRDLAWQCPLQRDGQGGWRCHGAVASAGARALRLELDLGTAATSFALRDGSARFALERNAATPDLTRFDFAAVPVAWAQALLAQAWPGAQLKAGTLAGALRLDSTSGRPLHLDGSLQANGLGLDTADASIAAEGVGGRFELDYRTGRGFSQVSLQGALHGGEILAGSSYVSLPATPVQLRIDARRQGTQGWQLPRIEWRDGDALTATGSAAFAPDLSLRALDLDVRSGDLSPLGRRYLSGQLAPLGLGEVELHGGSALQVKVVEGALADLRLQVDGAGLRDPAGRFGFEGLQGNVRHVSAGSADSALSWRGGTLYGLAFGAGQIPIRSQGGTLVFRAPVTVPLMGGTVRFEDVSLRPPAGEAGLDMRFALQLDGIDFGKVSQSLGLPAFQGTLSGRIPRAHYADERLDFDGGLSMQLFEGRVDFSALSLERPFGSAPSLSADIALDDLDLLRLTEVLEVGSVSGRLDGSVRGLRLVDWTPVAFDASFHTDAAAAERAGVRQRISQRAVQDISSVGDASFVSSLQGQLIGLFDDFGYTRIGIGCRLANEVCAMSGVGGPRVDRAPARDGSGQGGFTIVAGSGLPRLDVVGYNRMVDWPTLVERIAAAGKGDVKPVVQ